MKVIKFRTWNKETNRRMYGYLDARSIYGYLDAQGKMAIQPRFDNALPFRNGLARVKVGGRGRKIPGNDAYINKTGKIVWVGELRRNERVTTYSGKSMVDAYLDGKRAAGYTEDQIQRKKLSLEGVLVPVTARWNEELLRMAGFRSVDCFWRWMNFAAWIAVK